MKTNYILAIGLITAIITSCNSGIDQKAKQTSPLPPAGSLTNLPVTNTALPANSTDSNRGAATTTQTSSANAALNPAHGQPGHNCAIAVGAPLSGTAANSVTSAITTSITPATTQPQNPTINNSQPQLSVPNAKTTAGLNPAHGQPGHKCDIAVGAPLKN
ncbi:MAG: hypothetical protein ABR503_04395 [Chitinophagaceae bacterium]